MKSLKYKANAKKQGKNFVNEIKNEKIKTEIMETKNNNEQMLSNETTRYLYVPKNVVGSVLTELEEYSIQTDYFGRDTDGSGRSVFKVRTFPWQEPHLERIVSEMEANSEDITLLLTIIAEIAVSTYKACKSEEKKSVKEYLKRTNETK